jgi:hypothetical protein
MHRVDPVSLLAAVTLATSGLGVIVLCWRRRAVLAAVPALGGTAIGGLAVWCALEGRAASTILLGALAGLPIAIVLVLIGSALWRLLETPSDIK